MLFFPHRFQRESSELLKLVKSILKQHEQLLPLTLRQLFYQVISLEKSPLQNTEYDYQKLSRLMRDARYSGEISFECIEDRTRYTSNLPTLLNQMMDYYCPEAWVRQPSYVEIFVEKEALRSFFDRILSNLYVPVTAMKGFSSLSEVMDAAERFYDFRDGSRFALVFSDFDPSGESISKDFEFRLGKCLIMLGEESTSFSEEEKIAKVPNLLVSKIALTEEQVEKLNLPPKYAKPKDPRASKFIDKYGSQAVVELDATPPEILKSMIIEAVVPHLDMDEMMRIRKIEEKVKKEGVELLESLEDMDD